MHVIQARLLYVQLMQHKCKPLVCQGTQMLINVHAEEETENNQGLEDRPVTLITSVELSPGISRQIEVREGDRPEVLLLSCGILQRIPPAYPSLHGSTLFPCCTEGYGNLHVPTSAPRFALSLGRSFSTEGVQIMNESNAGCGKGLLPGQ